ncbi:Rtf2 RING-finger-domain-containing protein [Stachybotrys elegans]|uniref:Rtf2 RING-finger-domain-containing protein n=1 Tax=Stachybotrys elegans TaxID=80388 RepID=A0A8K0WMN9_9HYPO|nr:Rtf2 RING-finger-domain-containing protein [Stachybotrys elegans]
MGNDGGSIPKRSELVKNAARTQTTSELKATVLESLGHAWKHCALSGLPLDMDAVVSDYRGRLYNYEAVLRGLMPSDDETAEATPASFGIRSLRDVAKLKFSKSGGKWTCPISMKELGPATKAVYLVPCGHVFAEVAITEIQEENCPECAEAFTKDNIITVLPTAQKDMDRLEERLEALRSKGLTHTLKKDKTGKKKKRGLEEAEAGEAGEDDESRSSKKRLTKTDKKADKTSGINNPRTAELTAKVLAEQKQNQRRKMAESSMPLKTSAARG